MQWLGVDAERIHYAALLCRRAAARVDPPRGYCARSHHRGDDHARRSSFTAEFSRAQTILDGAQRLRSDLPFACKGGVCGTCRALVTDGAVDMRRNYALEPAEVEAGFVLTCQSYPTGARCAVDYDA